MRLKEICNRLNRLLDSERSADYAANGLQVDAGREVTRIAFAVDACMASFERAVAEGAELLVVHHGLFWGREKTVTGGHGRRLRYLIENGLSLYASHLPLDRHPHLGNNAVIAEEAGFTVTGWFGETKGLPIGALAESRSGLEYQEVLSRLYHLFEAEPQAVVPVDGAPDKVYRIGVVSGGGMGYALEAGRHGVDLFISGEMSHADYHPVLEAGVRCLLYGHYISEKPGVQRLSLWAAQELGVESCFIDIPTGM